MDGSSVLTREARAYAARELFRRAGISGEVFETWQVQTRERETVVSVGGNSSIRVVFPHAERSCWQPDSSGIYPVSRRTEMPGARAAMGGPSDFIVPFCSPNGDGLPLFTLGGSDAAICSCDLLASTLLTLSRYEEIQDPKRDAHGRFAATQSTAFRLGFLDRPVIDECALALERALRRLLSYPTTPRDLRVKLSHDVDLIGIPFSLRASAGHAFRRRKPSASLQDLMSLLGGAEPAYLRAVRILAKMSADRGLDSAFYWKASSPSQFDSGYDPRVPRIRRVIEELKNGGFELGVHPGYYTFMSPGVLKREVATLESIIGGDRIGGRQHYLRWCPDSWGHWESCGLAYDSSVGYADRTGFRAGTCIPFKPWLLHESRAANILEIPLIAMDVTFTDMGESPQTIQRAVGTLAERCRSVGGVFTLLWHNSSLLDPIFGDAYNEILALLKGAAKYDWTTDAA